MTKSKSVKLYKLTDANDQTMNLTQWGEGVEHRAPGKGELCSLAYLHAYRDPILAVMMAPAHVSWEEVHLWEARGIVEKDDGTKVGCTRLRTIKRLDLPVVTTEQRVRFAILAAKSVCNSVGWSRWADRWLSGEDRSEASASAARAAAAAGAAAVRAVAAAAARAAAAAGAAAAGEAAAAAAGAAAAGAAAVRAVAAAAGAAAVRAVAAAAGEAAARAGGSTLDLVAIAHRAVEEEK